MKGQPVSLRPFPATGAVPDLKITGNVTRYSRTLAVQYELQGSLAEYVIPEVSDKPLRKKSLWEETCLEFFLGPDNSDQYWEFNLSPAGHWNIYHFSAYREGMREEPVFASLPSNVSRGMHAFQLSLMINLDKINLSDKTLNAGISAVVKLINGELTYWALIHTGTEADFHRRDSFIITV